MRTAEEIKTLIEEGKAWSILLKLIEGEGRYWGLEFNEYKTDILGMEFKYIEGERSDECYGYVFSLDDVIFQCWTAYESWSNWGLEIYGLKGMYPVKKVTKTVEVWESA